MKRRAYVAFVVGTRPNFMKVAPVWRSIEARGDIEHTIIHTGQHYDNEMSGIFFEELQLPLPEVYLDVGPGSHISQTSRVIGRLEPILRQLRPDLVLVAGDVNSTLASALAATQLGIRVGHIEAGLRSFDWSMPEERNRILTDQISDLLFIHSPEARDHLLAEGRPAEAIHDVGNTMIDTLASLRDVIAARDAPAAYGLRAGEYLLVTLHRPALVDGSLLYGAWRALTSLADVFDVVFPVHPRTRARLNRITRTQGIHPRLQLLAPLGYRDFVGLMEKAAAVLTDSGGVQEETTYLGVPCFTLRANTERPITLTLGTNVLLGLDPARIAEIPDLLSSNGNRLAQVPSGWDGHAGRRIAEVIASSMQA
jgi:UDP-N-acetylglucosamine 2-epimerase (non-hydrolysing)